MLSFSQDSFVVIIKYSIMCHPKIRSVSQLRYSIDVLLMLPKRTFIIEHSTDIIKTLSRKSFFGFLSSYSYLCAIVGFVNTVM